MLDLAVLRLSVLGAMLLVFFAAESSAMVELSAGLQVIEGEVRYLRESPPFPDEEDGPLRSHVTPAELDLADFQQLDGDVFNLGFTADRVWASLRIRNGSDTIQSRYLLTGQRFMRPLEVFEEQSDGTYARLLYNDQFQTYSERTSPFRELVVELQFKPGEEKHLLMFVGAGGELRLDLALEEPETVSDRKTSELIAFAVFEAILLTLIVINIFHYVAVRRVANLLYALMEVSIGLYVAHIEGFAFQFLWPDLPIMNAYGTTLFGPAIHVTSVLFAVTFLEIRRGTIAFYFAAGYFLLGVSSFLSAFLISLQVSNVIGVFCSATGGFVLVGCGIDAWLKGNKSALYFVVGWILLGLSSFLFGLTVFGLIDSPLSSFNWIKLGALGEALLLSYALSDQVRRLNDDFAQNQALLVSNLEARLEEAMERVELEEANVAANQQLIEMDQRLASTSHDAKQPIYSLRLTVLGLAPQIHDNNVIEQLNRTLDHMEDVLGQNLEGQETAQAALPQNYGELLAEVRQTFVEEAADRHLQLRVVPSSQPLDVPLVPLKRVVFNLVANAVRHSGAKRLLLGISPRRDNVLLRIIDDGIGLPGEGEERSTAGTGLGLNIVRAICRDQGWELEINSEPGRGTAFGIRLPR